MKTLAFFFGTTDYESDLGFRKFKMTHPRWWTSSWNITGFYCKLLYSHFRDHRSHVLSYPISVRLERGFPVLITIIFHYGCISVYLAEKIIIYNLSLEEIPNEYIKLLINKYFSMLFKSRNIIVHKVIYNIK